MYSVEETITPEKAEEYLKRNAKNRKLKKRIVDTYANDMKSGKWQYSPQGISFYENGNLADGQHRLNAVVKAGVPVKMLVTYEVPSETTEIDRPSVRSPLDIAGMRGLTTDVCNNKTISAVRMLLEQYDGGSRTRTYSDSVIFSLFEDDSASEIMQQAYSVVGCGNHNPIAKRACCIASAFCALFCKVEKETLERFFYVVNSGYASCETESAAVTLRNQLINNNNDWSSASRKAIFAFTLQAIRDFSSSTSRVRRYTDVTKKPFFKPTCDELLCKFAPAE